MQVWLPFTTSKLQPGNGAGLYAKPLSRYGAAIKIVYVSCGYKHSEMNLHGQLQICDRECHPARWVFPSHRHVHSYHNDLLQHRIIYQ